MRCPEQLGAKGSSTFFQGFEESVTSKFGTRVADEEPFCGMYSSKNPNYIFVKPDPKKLGISLSQHRFVRIIVILLYLCCDVCGYGMWLSLLVSVVTKRVLGFFVGKTWMTISRSM